MSPSRSLNKEWTYYAIAQVAPLAEAVPPAYMAALKGLFLADGRVGEARSSGHPIREWRFQNFS